MAAVLLFVPMAFADTVVTPGDPGVVGTETVSGTAQILGGNQPPVVRYMWILPDEDPDGEPETQVNVDPGMERSDIYACIVVSDPQGRDTIEKVFAKVYHPDGTYKYQVHARLLNPLDEVDATGIKDCIADGVAADLISESEAYDLALDHGIDYNIFDQQNWHMYKVYLPMYYHQPAGMYDVKVWATDANSGLSQTCSTETPCVNNRWFEWVAGTYLVLDFDSIDFGDALAPGVWTDIDGDLDMGTPARPTLKNNGNTEVQVSVMFSDFVGEMFEKRIDLFDAQLRNLQATNNWHDVPGEHFEFPSMYEQVFTYPIELCRHEKIDFSIHPDSGAVPDIYSGELTIYATPVVVSTPPYADDGTFLTFSGFHASNPVR
jgi:hypothetical protein